jgi:tetratricopeptide (TPR) repeat protein
MQRFWLALLLCLSLCAACDSGREESRSLQKARTAFAQGFFLEAEKGFQAYLKAHPNGPHRLEAWNRLVEIAVNVKGDNAAGMSLLEAMLLEYGGNPDKAWPIMSKLGDLFVRAGELDKAIEVWHRRLEMEGLTAHQKTVARLDLARVFQHQGEFDTAKDTLQECVQVADAAQDKADCLYELAQTQYYLRNMKEAKAALEELMALPRESVAIETRTHAAFVLADIYEHQRQFSKACELLESILEEHPNPRAVRARLGLIK